MSVSALNPVKNSTSPDADCSSLELVKLIPKWQEGLKLLLQNLRENGDDAFFSPHPTDSNSIDEICNHNGKDAYYLLVNGERVLGYGLLRGWDEGFSIPSLGIAIHPLVRGIGLGELLMNFLHFLALHKGASQVRLRVHIKNIKAANLYEKLGYVFEERTTCADYLIGFKRIRK